MEKVHDNLPTKRPLKTKDLKRRWRKARDEREDFFKRKFLGSTQRARHERGPSLRHEKEGES